MKPVVISILLLCLLGNFYSCEKEFRCVCDSERRSAFYTDTFYSIEYLMEGPKKNAKIECDKGDFTLSKTATLYTTSCELK